MFENKYSNIIISRATIDIGDNSIGFLPGKKEDKMSHWIQPMKDNIDLILSKINVKDIEQPNIKNDENFNKKNKNYSNRIQKKKRTQNISIDEPITTDLLINSAKVNIECISFFRGRTFIDTFCIIDEAQNLNHHEIKTIITRIGKGSKLILMGDLEQSDLKKTNTDFYDIINKMANHSVVGVIKLDNTVRSGVASLAVKLL